MPLKKVRALPRFYDAVLVSHLRRHRQMAFVSRPRQVGKTTTCRARTTAYLSWDDDRDRRLILQGPSTIADHLGLDVLREKPLACFFDELHKNPRWKSFLRHSGVGARARACPAPWDRKSSPTLSGCIR
jgi:hypothetical protein